MYYYQNAYQATSPGTQQPPFGHSYQPPAMNGNAAPPHSQFFSAAYPSSPNQYAGPSAAPQQFNPYSYNPLPQSPSVQSIPEPARRAEYQAPVFKTFQERKREREAALRTASGGTPLNDSPVGSPMKAAGVLPTTSVRPTPPSSALAMMGIPGQPAPAPPPRIRPLPVAQPQLPAQNWGGVPTPPLRSTSPVPPSASPAPSSVSTSSSSRVVQQPPSISGPSQVPPRTASPVPPAETPLPNCATGIPSARPAAVSAIVERSDTVSSVKSVDRVGFGPSRRALPRPPSAVAPSKSLDRGNLPSTGGGRRLPRRGPSPISEEDTATLVSRLAGVSVGGIVPNSSPPTTASSPRSPITPSDSPPAIAIQGMSPLPSICVDEVTKLPGIPTISIGSETERKSPPVPVINIAAETKTPSVPIIAVNDTGSSLPSISVSPPQVSVSPPSRPASPGFAISGLPTIEVSSSDTRLEQGGPVPTAVPQIRTQPVTPSKASPGPTRIHTNSAILCAGCTNPIIGRIVSAMNQRWHPQCFMCGVCNELLEHVSAYEHEGKPYCHLDYHDRFAHKCHHCQTPIVDPSFVTLEDENLGQRYYHELHFFCSECGDPFLDPSKSSAPGGLAQGDETNPFVIHKGHPYCERCHLRLHKPKCKKCTQPIPDVAVSAMGAKWHANCFVCDNCDGPFANNLFFPKEGRAFCTECFGDMN